MLNGAFTNTMDLLDTAIAVSNRSVQPNLLRSKIDDLFEKVGDRLLFVHKDSRRSIYEDNGTDFSIQEFEVHSANVPLGNHFHKKSGWKKTIEDANFPGLSEIFVFDKWSWILLLRDISLDGKALWEVKKIGIIVNDIIMIPPYQAHTFYLLPGTQFRWFRPYPFDERNKDMNPYTLELPLE